MSTDTALTPQTPWPGLRAFGEDDREFFFGRERETAELQALLQRATVIVLYGQSGLGKTSLLQAGLFPSARESGLIPFRLRLAHGDEAPPLADQVKARLTDALDDAKINGPRPRPDETLWEYFHRRDVDLWGARNRLVKPLIVLDQFEEVFTLGQRTETTVARVAAFADELEALLEHRPPQAVRDRLDRNPEAGLQYDFQRTSVKIVISLREDFLAQLDTWRTRMPSLLPYRFRLERLSGARALDVVRGAGGNLVDDEVARDIVDFVSRSQRRTSIGPVEQRSVEPALLSVVCDELNRYRIKRGETRLTADLISGERGAIIQNFYDRAFDDVEPAARDWVESCLLTSSGFRDRAALEDALKDGLDESAFDRLVERRILHREERDGVIWLELTHDLLTDPAVASRIGRQQQKAAADATRREKEIARQLSRTRALAGVFGVLLLATVAALIMAAQMWRAAGRDRDAAQKAEKTAQKNADDLKAAIGKADESFSTALTMADRSGQNQLENVRRDMRMQTANLRKIIENADRSYDRLTEQGSEPGVTNRHARFLATAAEALYQTGHLTDGLVLADHGRTLLAQAKDPEAADTRAVLAELVLAQGKGRAALGQTSAAIQDFTEAIALADAASRTAHWTDQLVRVHTQAHLAWAELQLIEMSYASAAARCAELLRFLDAHPSSDADARLEAETWRVIALMRAGQAHAVAADAEAWIAKADDALGKLVARDPANLRLTRLSSEVTYQRGRVALRLSDNRQAAAFFARASAASDVLIEHDPENLEWKLNAVQVRRGEGFRLNALEEVFSERAALTAAAKDAADLIKAQPDWRRAHYLRAAVLDDLADSYQVTEYFDRTQAMFQDAAAEFAGNAKRDPNDLESVRGVSLTYSHLAGFLYRRKEYDAAARMYGRSLDAVAPAVRPETSLSFVPTDVAFSLQWMGQAWANQKNWTEASAAFSRGETVLGSLTAREPKAANFDTLTDLLVSWGDVLRASGDSSGARTRYDRAAEAAAKARKADPTGASPVHDAALVARSRAMLLASSGDTAAAIEQYDQAGALLWSALQKESWNTALQDDLDAVNGSLKILKDALARPAGSTAPPSPHIDRIDRLLGARQTSQLTDWIMTPIMPGPWRNLTGNDLRAARKLVVAAFPRFMVTDVFAVRVLALPWSANNARVIEAGVFGTANERGIVVFVPAPDSASASSTSALGGGGSQWFYVLNGDADPVYRMNAASPPRLDTKERAIAYSRFFVGILHSGEGQFRIVEGVDDIAWRKDATPALKTSVAKQLMPVAAQAAANGNWTFDCTYIYGNTVSKLQLTVQPGGAIHVEKDTRLQTNLPIMAAYLVDGVKVLRDVDDKTVQLVDARRKVDANPSDRETLTRLRDLARTQRLWPEAVEVQKQLIDVIRANQSAGSDSQLSNAYVTLSWMQLFAKDFAGALASTEAGLKLAPGDLALQTDRAHALMFLGRLPEADAIYRGNLGKFMPGDDGKPSDRRWEQEILSDFASMELRNLTHPAMPKVRALMQDSVMETARKRVEASPSDRSAIGALRDLARDFKRWTDAVSAQEKLLKLVQASATPDKQDLLDTYLGLSWYQLFARDFTGALNSTTAGLKIDPGYLPLDTNRAHALLFLNRVAEANAVYRGNMGKKMPGSGDLWQTVILDDLNQLEAGGLKHPEFARLRTMLKGGSTSLLPAIYDSAIWRK